MFDQAKVKWKIAAFVILDLLLDRQRHLHDHDPLVAVLEVVALNLVIKLGQNISSFVQIVGVNVIKVIVIVFSCIWISAFRFIRETRIFEKIRGLKLRTF